MRLTYSFLVIIAIVSFMIPVNAMPAVKGEVKKRNELLGTEEPATDGVCLAFSTFTACP